MGWQSQPPSASALQLALAWALAWPAVAQEPSGQEQVVSAQVAGPGAFEVRISPTVGPSLL